MCQRWQQRGVTQSLFKGDIMIKIAKKTNENGIELEIDSVKPLKEMKFNYSHKNEKEIKRINCSFEKNDNKIKIVFGGAWTHEAIIAREDITTCISQYVFEFGDYFIIIKESEPKSILSTTLKVDDKELTIIYKDKSEFLLKKFMDENWMIVGDSWMVNNERFFKLNENGKFKIKISDEPITGFQCFKKNGYYLCIKIKKEPIKSIEPISLNFNSLANIYEIEHVVSELQKLMKLGYTKIDFSSQLKYEYGRYYSAPEITVTKVIN